MDTLYFEVLFENICKGIEFSDEKMQEIIIKTSQVYNIILRKLIESEEYRDIITDKMMLKEPMLQGKGDNFISVDWIMNKYLNLKVDKITYNNYPNDLILYGKYSGNISRLFSESKIANVRKSRSGYLIEFNDIASASSNEFINDFSASLWEMGILNLAIPLVVLDNLWN